MGWTPSEPQGSNPSRLEMLAARPLLRSLAFDVLREIDGALESVRVQGGAAVVRRGDPDVPLMLVVEGGLRASFEGADGRRHVVFESFRGATLGEALVLSGRPSPLDVHAIRDTRLLCLSRDRFDAIALRHPDLALHFARRVTGRLVEIVGSTDFLSSFSRKADRLPRSVALLSIGGAQARRMRDLLRRELATVRTAVLWTPEEPFESVDPDRFELVIFECDPSDAAALDFSLRQADRVVVLVDDEAPSPADQVPQWWRHARLAERPVHLELAMVHPRSRAQPRGGGAYASLPNVARLHHVREGDVEDAARLARWVFERPVGVVLGGGGAYGIAHVGVLKALEEARIPVDIVGGTSMGAIFAGGLARGWSADRIMSEVRRLFAARFALYDPTLPIVSLLRGRKLDRVLEGLFEGLEIGDLWRPFFSVTTNLSLARPEVRDRGKLRDAIRASVAIPGLFPPHLFSREVLVDGGLVDNLPIDVMAERCAGPVVAVDVFPYRRGRTESSGGAPGGGEKRRVFERLRGLFDVRLPVFDILMRSSFVGSQRTTETALSVRPPALYLVPDLGRFRILEWGAYEALFAAGYQCAKRELDRGALRRSLFEGRVAEPAPQGDPTLTA